MLQDVIAKEQIALPEMQEMLISSIMHMVHMINRIRGRIDTYVETGRASEPTMYMILFQKELGKSPRQLYSSLDRLISSLETDLLPADVRKQVRERSMVEEDEELELTPEDMMAATGERPGRPFREYDFSQEKMAAHVAISYFMKTAQSLGRYM